MAGSGTSSVDIGMSLMVDEMSSERCFEAWGEAMSVIAG